MGCADYLVWKTIVAIGEPLYWVRSREAGESNCRIDRAQGIGVHSNLRAM